MRVDILIKYLDSKGEIELIEANRYDEFPVQALMNVMRGNVIRGSRIVEINVKVQ